jgi:two-component system sensor histidine kinase DegS
MMDTPQALTLEDVAADLDQEIETLQTELKEINLLVTQSRAEVEKLTQRNAQIAGQMRSMQANLENMTRSEIKAVYDGATDAQQRLFAMRGQLEKLQSDQANLDRLMRQLAQVREALGAISSAQRGRTGMGPNGQLVLSRVIEAQEAERLRLSRQIHDGPAQALSNFVLQSEIAIRLFEKDQNLARTELGNMKQAATGTLGKIRDFIFDLRPMMLDDLGLVPTLRRYVEAFKDKTGIPTNLQVIGPERRLESMREVLLFRGMQELLANARNHAQATEIAVDLDVDDNRIRVMVEDNGLGFDPETALNNSQKGIGLAALKERLEVLGGGLAIESQTGQGSRITMELPVGDAL